MRLFRAASAIQIALRPVITATRDEPHPVAVTLDAETEAIVLDFVEPRWTSQDLAIGQAQAGTTPFSPMSARRRTPTLPRRAAGARFCGHCLTTERMFRRASKFSLTIDSCKLAPPLPKRIRQRYSATLRACRRF